MTDDRNPDEELRFELASAYLDGEATADERAVVEGDPELLAAVERLRRLRDELAQAPPAPSATRDAAIAAAMAAFDESPDNVVDLVSRRRARWLQGLSAAAVVAIVAVGAVVVVNRDGDEPDVASENAGVAVVSTAAVQPQRAPDTQPSESELDGDAAVAPQIAESESAARPTTTAAAGPAAAPAVPETTATTTAPMAADAAAGRPVVRNAAELAELAGRLDPAPPRLDAVLDACDAGDAEADAIYVTADGDEVEVVIARTADGSAAVSLDECDVVLDAPA